MKINSELIEKAIQAMQELYPEQVIEVKINVLTLFPTQNDCNIVSEKLSNVGAQNTNVYAYPNNLEVTIVDAIEDGKDVFIEELIRDQPKLTLVK